MAAGGLKDYDVVISIKLYNLRLEKLKQYNQSIRGGYLNDGNCKNNEIWR